MVLPQEAKPLKQPVIWNKTCCCLMSTPRSRYYRRSFTTGFLLPCISATWEGEKAVVLGFTWGGGTLKCLRSGEEREDSVRRTGVRAPMLYLGTSCKGVLSSWTSSWELPPHNKTKKKNYCLIIAVSQHSSVIALSSCYLGPWKLSEGRGPWRKVPWSLHRHGMLRGM